MAERSAQAPENYFGIQDRHELEVLAGEYSGRRLSRGRGKLAYGYPGQP